MKTIIYSLLLLGLLVFFIAAPSAAYTVTGSGCSVSKYGYLSELSKEYERRTGTKILVRGGGTVIGIEDLRGGAVDFAAACRSRTGDDPDDLDFVQVAWDALVFVTHKGNRVENVSLDAVRGIYSGEIANWKQLGGKDVPIKVFLSKSGKGLSGIEWSLQEMVLRGKQPVQSARVTSLASTGIVEQIVENTAEGFAAAGYSSARKRNVRILRLNGVSPSYRTIVNGTYTLVRPLFIIVPRKPKPEVKQFLDFVLSREGQQFINSQGVVSLETMKQKR